MSEAAREWGELWGKSGSDWADLQEGVVRPPIERVLDRLHVASGDRLLDVGCGAGGGTQLAAERGANVTGIDAAEPLIAIARQRLPHADLRVGDMNSLPWPDGSFDVVTGFNAYQYADDPVAALRESLRVLKRGGRLGVVVWGPADECEAVAHFLALRALLPPNPNAPGPLAGEEAVADWITEAGFELLTDELVDTPWEYPDVATAVRALMSAGPIARVVAKAGGTAVEGALTACANAYRTPAGRVLFRNKFRALTAVA